MMASGQKASGVVTEHGVDITKDVEILHSMGYAQELSRRMGGFQNFAISFSIICILAGGITAFQSGFSGAGGASIGYGWPIGCAFSLIVAASIGQSARPIRPPAASITGPRSSAAGAGAGPRPGSTSSASSSSSHRSTSAPGSSSSTWSPRRSWASMSRR